MEREELLKKLSAFLNEAMMGRAKDVSPDDDLADKVGLDSMGTVEFVTPRSGCRDTQCMIDRGRKILRCLWIGRRFSADAIR